MCFDMTTQTSAFIDSIPEYAAYTWDAHSKIATILFNEDDTLKITEEVVPILVFI